ncbi:MAG: hypothetical protein ABSA86_01425 [Oryzomonas sp.]
MNMFRYFGAVLLLFVILVLPSCGNNNTDTSGTLTVGTPTVGTSTCGQQTVSATITYTPPSLVTGAVPNGVQVAVNWYENNVLMHTHTETLGDSPSFNIGYLVSQQPNAGPTFVEIIASIGGMNSSALTTIPAFTNFSGCSL